MRPYLVIEKAVGETPLEALTRAKREHGIPEETSASYAGRLDPMASGKLLVLLGSECTRQSAYTGLDKEYQVEVVLDVGTDTGDVLGMPELLPQETKIDRSVMTRFLRSELGTHERAYPRFSSKTVGGKPLFLHTLEGTIDHITIPTHPETVHRIKMEKLSLISASELRERVLTKLARTPRSDDPRKALGADFRIGGILPAWEEQLCESNRTFTLVTLTITCGTGTYMRSLAERLGAVLATRACALSIHRTKIGRYGWPGVWWRLYR